MNTLRQYKIVIDIARFQSVSKAAESLGISQPTLSKFLQKLEASLGTELFDRASLPIKLTLSGERFINAGRKIMDAERQLQKELDDIKASKNSAFKIGISPSRASYILPELIDAYLRINSQGKVVIRERTTNQLSSELADGELDLIISILCDETKMFPCVPLFTEQILLAIPAKWRDDDIVSLLTQKPVITIGSGQHMNKIMCSILEDIGGVQPKIECQTFESAFGLVNEGLGVTLVPSYMTKNGESEKNEKVVFLRLPEDFCNKYSSSLQRKVCIFYRKKQFLTASEQQFLKICSDISRKIDL